MAYGAAQNEESYEPFSEAEETREVAMVESLQTVREYARLARDDEYYFKVHLLNLFMAGEYESLKSYKKGGYFSSPRSSDQDLPDYPYINPAFMDDGLVNHTQISSRINVQSVVYADPEVEFVTKLGNVKAVLLSWLQKRWRQGDWENKFYEIGMDVETCGYGYGALGINWQGLYDVERIAPGDVMRDHLRRSPAEWRYVFIRRRLDVEEAVDKYKDAVDANRIRNCATSLQLADSLGFGTRRGKNSEPTVRIVYEWSYWSRRGHCVFLGGIQSGIVLSLELSDDMMSYTYKEGPVGINPFDEIPLAVWTDSYIGASRQSIGKAESTMPIAQMLNNMEVCARESIKRGMPMNVVSSVGMKPSIIKALEENQDYEELGKLIITDNDDASRAFHRVPPIEIKPSFFNIRAQLKQELNGATGVMDSQRGQIKPGERTAYEFRRTEASGGVQARHMRHQYAKFMAQVVEKGRKIAALYESVYEILVLPEGDEVDTSTIDMSMVLAHPVELRIHEESLNYRSEDEKMQARLALFNGFESVLLQSPMPLLNVAEIVQDVYRHFGMRDPGKFLNPAVLQGGTPPGMMGGVPPQPGMNSGAPA